MPTQDEVLNVLKEVEDPEIGVNVVDLGLVYNVDVKDSEVSVDMTLTAPGCPMHETIARAAAMAIETPPAVNPAHVTMVWHPPWTPDRITEEGRRPLGF